jgi:hypothetical protein
MHGAIAQKIAILIFTVSFDILSMKMCLNSSALATFHRLTSVEDKGYTSGIQPFLFAYPQI